VILEAPSHNQLFHHALVNRELEKPMKRGIVVSTLVLSTLAFTVLAAPMGVQGSIKIQGNAPANLRIAAMLTDSNGRPTAELASSAAVNNAFNLNVSDAAPPAPFVSSLATETLDWPGLVGKVNLSGATRVARVVFRAYLDADNSKTFTAGDTLLETFVTRARGGVVMIWSESRVRVQADRGFDVTLEPGWNLIVIELGKTVTAKRAGGVDGLVLEVFGR
jgi:hypothetical protein